MNVLFLLDRPELGGGVKVVCLHANLLSRLGHSTTVCARGPRPSWLPFTGPYVDADVVQPSGAYDLVVATFWTTVAAAERLNCGPVVHYCQGFEGDLAHLAASRPDIDRAYARPLPAFAVTPFLAARLRADFGKDVFVVPPPADPLFYPAWRHAPRRRPRIFVSGIFEAEVKGVRTALEAVRRLRDRGLACRVTRVSALPLSDDERSIVEPDEYLHQASPADVAAALRRSDLLLFTSTPAEGFGLPLLEAMTARVPAVATRTPGTEFMTEGAVALAKQGDSAAIAELAAALLTSPAEWRAARRRGARAAARFSGDVIGPIAASAIAWAAERASAPR